MADKPFGFVPVEFRGSVGAEDLIKVYLGSGQTINIGDPVQILSNVGARRATTTQSVFGIAAEEVSTADASNRLSILVSPTVPGREFRVQFTGTTTDVTQDKVGQSYVMTGNSGVMGLDVSKTTGGPWRLVAIERDVTGADGTGTYAIGRVMCQKSQFTGQS